MTVNETIDDKVISKVKKLLNLARDGGATEAEANLAMERAEAIMLDHNLSMAAIELAGSGSQEGRNKDSGEDRATFHWQRQLMLALAETCFCYVQVRMGTARIRGDNYREVPKGYELIGRVSNVITVKNMYSYLLATAHRLRKEFLTASPDHSRRDGAMFVEGLSRRLEQRIRERHQRILREQAATAAAARARAATNGNANALMVVLNDYAQQEAELNNDIARGWPPGTTTKQRLEREAKEQAREAKMAELTAAGVPWDVAWYMANMNYDRAKAKKAWADEQALRKAEQPKSFRRFRYRKSHQDHIDERMARRSMSPAWRAGEDAAEDVSLDEQVAYDGDRRRLAR